MCNEITSPPQASDVENTDAKTSLLTVRKQASVAVLCVGIAYAPGICAGVFMALTGKAPADRAIGAIVAVGSLLYGLALIALSRKVARGEYVWITQLLLVLTAFGAFYAAVTMIVLRGEPMRLLGPLLWAVAFGCLALVSMGLLARASWRARRVNA